MNASFVNYFYQRRSPLKPAQIFIQPYKPCVNKCLNLPGSRHIVAVRPPDGIPGERTGTGQILHQLPGVGFPVFFL